MMNLHSYGRYLGLEHQPLPLYARLEECFYDSDCIRSRNHGNHSHYTHHHPDFLNVHVCNKDRFQCQTNQYHLDYVLNQGQSNMKY